MSVSAVVIPDQIEATIKKALAEFLSSFFDGIAHSIGANDPIVCPACDIRFNRQQLPATLAKTMIVIQRSRSGVERRWVRRLGHDLRKEASFRFTVISSNRERSWRENDKVQDAIGLIFHTAAYLLAQSGLRVLSVSEPQPGQDDNHEYQISHRDIRLFVTLELNHAGERASAPLRGGVA